jgi:hypothetical protein
MTVRCTGALRSDGYAPNTDFCKGPVEKTGRLCSLAGQVAGGVNQDFVVKLSSASSAVYDLVWWNSKTTTEADVVPPGGALSSSSSQRDDGPGRFDYEITFPGTGDSRDTYQVYVSEVPEDGDDEYSDNACAVQKSWSRYTDEPVTSTGSGYKTQIVVDTEKDENGGCKRMTVVVSRSGGVRLL